MGGLVSKNPEKELELLEVETNKSINLAVEFLAQVLFNSTRHEKRLMEQQRQCTEVLKKFRCAFLNKNWSELRRLHTEEFLSLIDIVSGWHYLSFGYTYDFVLRELKKISEGVLRLLQLVPQDVADVADAAAVPPTPMPQPSAPTLKEIPE